VVQTVLIVAVLVSANVLGAFMTAPQVVRLWRTRSTGGVSGPWAGVGVAMNTWWLLYGVQSGIPALIPLSVVAVGLYATVVFLVARVNGRAELLRLVSISLPLGLIPLPFLLVGGWSIAGVVIGLSYGAQFVPALISAVRTDQPKGISPVTWLMAWAEAALWLVFSAIIANVPLMLGGGSGLVIATLILARLWSVRRHDGLVGGRVVWTDESAGLEFDLVR
jgi:uncharacterized protein with PQ loop repeat